MQNWNWELISAVVAIIATIIGGIWFISRKIYHLGRIFQRFEDLNTRTRNANCDSHSKDIKEMKTIFSSHDEDIKTIKEFLLITNKKASVLFSVKNSPRQLNEIGNKVFAEMQGEDFLNQNKEYLFSQIDGYNPKTALDVENSAHAVCMTSVDKEIFNGLKNFVYNSPSYKIIDREGKERMYDLAMSDICFILSLPLRDMYLEIHPEILSK